MRNQDKGSSDIHDQCDAAEHAHHLCIRLLLHQHPIGSRGKDAQAQRAEEQALKQGRAGAPGETPADSQEPQERDEPVAHEVESIGLECLRVREEASGSLDDTVANVEQNDDPECPRVAGGEMAQLLRQVVVVCVAAGAVLHAGCIHVIELIADHGHGPLSLRQDASVPNANRHHMGGGGHLDRVHARHRPHSLRDLRSVVGAVHSRYAVAHRPVRRTTCTRPARGPAVDHRCASATCTKPVLTR